eukprot:jgi/Astpho2/6476/Aster-x0732
MAVTVNGAPTTYANCQALVTGMQLLWTVNAGSNGGAVLNGAIIGPSTTGWAGFGFPDSAGSMVPGNAIIVKADSTASTGASINDYRLAGYQTSSVTVPSQLTVSNTSASVSGSTLVGTFSTLLAQTGARAIIAAHGPVSSGALQQHDLSDSIAGTFTFALSTPTASGPSAAPESSTPSTMPESSSPSTNFVSQAPSQYWEQVHGILVTVGWGIVLPIGIWVARSFKTLDPWWFMGHLALQLVGVIIGIVGFGIALTLEIPDDTTRDHRGIGIAVFSLGIFQTLMGFFRIHKGSRWRMHWAWVHRILGSSLVALAAANVFLGLHIARPDGYGAFVAGYAAFLGVMAFLIVLGTAFDFWRQRQQRRRQHLGPKPAMTKPEDGTAI